MPKICPTFGQRLTDLGEEFVDPTRHEGEEQASIHTSDAIYDKLEEWQQRQIEIFQLPSYSPQLNSIEILWRFIKHEWIEVSAYRSWQSLVEYVETVLKEFGDTYVINFV